MFIIKIIRNNIKYVFNTLKYITVPNPNISRSFLILHPKHPVSDEQTGILDKEPSISIFLGCSDSTSSFNLINNYYYFISHKFV